MSKLRQLYLSVWAVLENCWQGVGMTLFVHVTVLKLVKVKKSLTNERRTMTYLDPMDIIDELLSEVGFDFVRDLEGDDIVADLNSRSGSVGWGLDTYDILQAWSIKPGVGFLVDIHLDGTPDDETSILGTSILVKVKGKAVKKGVWEVAEYEVVEADFYPPDDYLDEEQLEAILSNTEFYRTFIDEISSLQLLNTLHIVDLKAHKTLKRQIYIGTIACLETYLSDAFINTVLSKKSYLRSFFASFKDFKEQKLGMNELLERADQAEDIAKKAMLEVIYHHLAKVKKMYESTLAISFPDFSAVQSDVGIRHDLVHRNGKTKKDQEIAIDTAKVNEVIVRVVNFVDQIDRELKEKEQRNEKNL